MKKYGLILNAVLLAVLARPSAFGRGTADPYASLLTDENIASDIVWEGNSGPMSYSSWSVRQQADLSRALAAVETGKPAGLRAAPEPIGHIDIDPLNLDKKKFPAEKPAPHCEDDGHVLITSEDAWKIYLAHVAHSLWLERHGKVGWSLKTMSKSERALLLDSRFLQKRKNEKEFDVTRFVMGHALSWDPTAAYRFLVEKKLLGDTPEETVIAVTGWASRNLRHITASETYADIYGYPGPIPVDRILNAAVPGPWKVGGCWGVTGFYAGVLRGANIPVENSMIGGHSRPIFPSAGLALNHGDDIYTSIIGPSGNAVPSRKLLLSRDEWARLVESPELDCVEGKCNTPREQADFNIGRRQRQLAREYMTDWALYNYISKGPEYLNDSLRGYRVDNKFVTYAMPYLSAEERRAFIAEVEAELRRLGGGDTKKGGEIVLRRSDAFWH